MIDVRIGSNAGISLGEIDLVNTSDAGDLRSGSSEPDHPWVKQRDIGFQLLRRVHLRIDGDEQRLHRLAHWPKRVNRAGDGLQVGRTSIGTVGKTEIDQQQLAAELSIGSTL